MTGGARCHWARRACSPSPPECRWRIPTLVHGNLTGTANSALAALLSGLVEHLPQPDRLFRAVALSAATVQAAGKFDPVVYEGQLERGR